MKSKITKKTEVIAALQLWQAFEYLSPQTPPKPECVKGSCVWRLDPQSVGDEQMPWVDSEKVKDLAQLLPHPKRFLLYAGIIPGMELVENLRRMLNAPALDFSEKMLPGNAASVVLPIDEHGYVAGEPFVSTVPWALAGIQRSTQANSHFDFSGFFGLDGVQAETVKDMRELLVKLQLMPTKVEGEEADKSAPLEFKKKMFRTVLAEDIRQLTALAFNRLGWAPSNEADWVIQTQRISAKGGKRLEDPLNSFYAEEIENVQHQYSANCYGQVLAQFLESKPHPDRIDLDKDTQCVIDGVHPAKLPFAAWPGKHPLVTAQQFAVNTICNDLASNPGIFSVNGPPGTGKTTLLKDIVAAVVQRRADALYQFEDPELAFAGKLTVENHHYPVWRLDDSLRGFGIVVTSANNGAVENISKELPGISAIDERLAPDYFTEVADSIGLEMGKKRPQTRTSWGLVSAVLGNSSNRNAFAYAFWWEDTKRKEENEEPDPLRPISLQAWINQNLHQTPDWAESRREYAQAKSEVERLRASAARLADRLAEYAAQTAEQENLSLQLQAAKMQLPQLERQNVLASYELRQAQAEHQSAVQANARVTEIAGLEALQAKLQASKKEHSASRPENTLERLDQIAEDAVACEAVDDKALSEHLLHRPGFLWLLFRRDSVKRWEDRRTVLELRTDASRQRVAEARQALHAATNWNERMKALEQQIIDVSQQLEQAYQGTRDIEITTPQVQAHLVLASEALAKAQASQRNTQQALDTAITTLSKLQVETQRLAADASQSKDILSKAGLIDVDRPAWQLGNQPRDRFHKASPYQDDDLLFDARRALFIASMNLHKAFLMNAWKKMKPTLAAFVSLLQGQLPAHNVRDGVMALWDVFFLAVPLVSTTFASFPRLFRGVGSEDLAWLLIDEAGQAAPQQAIGALWRAQRAVIVGDPLQLEPVVGIPEEIVTPLKEYCGTPAMYVPPDASTQTLADRSNRFGTYLGQRDADSEIWLGAPLIVHRRCLNPMFDIANAIAYDNKMVYGTFGESGGEPRSSHWIDMPNDGAIGHWIPAQGERAIMQIMNLTEGKLRDDDNKLRIYVITPFRNVAEKMRELLTQSFNYLDASEMCGTVHTFQGKEADFVIFLLGGDPGKPGVIASYAGRKPNLVNVAVTRAKKRLYVIGKRDYWCSSNDVNRFYAVMAQKLDVS